MIDKLGMLIAQMTESDKDEIARLRQRVEELEAENNRLAELALKTLPSPVDGTIGQVVKDAERYRAWRASALDEGYAEYDLQGKTEQDVDAMCDQMIEEAP